MKRSIEASYNRLARGRDVKRRMSRMALVCAVVMAACSPAPTPSTAEDADGLLTSTGVESGVAAVVDMWFDPGTARELMNERQEFDERIGRLGAFQ